MLLHPRAHLSRACTCYRAAHHALDALKAGRSDDEELVCIVENDACGVDAIQVITGCSVGKGNLIFRDFSKHAYTFIDRRYNQAIRLVQRPEPEIPERERIFQQVQCASCGEMVAEHRTRVSDRKFLCIPCAGDYRRD